MKNVRENRRAGFGLFLRFGRVLHFCLLSLKINTTKEGFSGFLDYVSDLRFCIPSFHIWRGANVGFKCRAGCCFASTSRKSILVSNGLGEIYPCTYVLQLTAQCSVGNLTDVPSFSLLKGVLRRGVAFLTRGKIHHSLLSTQHVHTPIWCIRGGMSSRGTGHCPL